MTGAARATATIAGGRFEAIELDAYDDDGMYWLTLGDAFMPRPAGDNGATLEYVHQGAAAVDVYVDDDSSGCAGGANPDGPQGSYPCVGGAHEVSLP